MSKGRARRQGHARWQVILIAVAGVMVTGYAAFVVHQGGAGASDAIGPRAAITSSPSESATPSAPTLKQRALRSGTSVAFFGDSWTVGYAATKGNGFASDTAKAFGWKSINLGVSGTGYLSGSSTDSSYPQRMAQAAGRGVKLVLIQGSVNDAGAIKGDIAKYTDAAKKTWSLAQKRFPKAQVAVVGPVSPYVPAPGAYDTMDSALAAAAQEAGVVYVSPQQERWFDETVIDRSIDKTKKYHPTTYGHAVFAKRLEADLRTLAKG